ncbi:MAG: hypothetical protein ALECFALPRED_001655 [Alectoria fallacina]|uniref:Uncharacterized protein n=1 Tax=Alectoria fallacina TaxID=1903189 RepID=A0A8H3IMP5_9LECA|nr:MAG: hypothetical protein ALECFALPRED_001655 [Alectoria fallacina]
MARASVGPPVLRRAPAVSFNVSYLSSGAIAFCRALADRFTMALVNVWHLRRVAEASAKPCDICYKPNTSVLITPDNKDYFYVCPGHLKDRGFCTPIIDEAEVAAKKKKEEMDREIELVKKEYEDKIKKKKNSKDKNGEDKDKDKEKGEDNESKGDGNDEKAEKEKDAKIKAITNQEPPSVADDIPRIYALQKYDYLLHPHRGW